MSETAQQLISFFQSEIELLTGISKETGNLLESGLAHQIVSWLEYILEELEKGNTTPAFDELKKLKITLSDNLKKKKNLDKKTRNSYSIRLKKAKELLALAN